MNISALLVYACLQGTLSIVFGQGWRGSLFSVVDATAHGATFVGESYSSLSLAHETFQHAIPETWWKQRTEASCISCDLKLMILLVDGSEIRKQPPGMYEALVNNGIKLLGIHWFAGFLNHQQCDFRRFWFKPHHTLRSFKMQGGVLKIGVENYIP